MTAMVAGEMTMVEEEEMIMQEAEGMTMIEGILPLPPHLLNKRGYSIDS